MYLIQYNPHKQNNQVSQQCQKRQYSSLRQTGLRLYLRPPRYLLYQSQQDDYNNLVSKLQYKFKVEKIVQLEANIDDMQPQVHSFALQQLMKVGALDVTLQQVVMKKGRPGIVLQVLCTVDKAEQCIDELIKQSTTLGIRVQLIDRIAANRRLTRVTTQWGEVSMKEAVVKGQSVRAHPEYEECCELALQHDVSLQDVMDEAKALWLAEQQALE